jgi:curved DNA-binding protein CbpA
MTDPRAVLGIPLNATDDDIRAAYLIKVKEHSPERSPEEFEKIRDAYDTLRDPRRRACHLLLCADPAAPFSSLLTEAPERRYSGPDPWLEVLKQK